MTIEELQERINQKDKSAEEMRKIGESYLRGDVLKDLVAAEGWLQRVVESEDSIEAPIAMALIAKELLGKEQILSDADFLAIKREWEVSEGENRKELETLLGLATEKQKRLQTIIRCEYDDKVL